MNPKAIKYTLISVATLFLLYKGNVALNLGIDTFFINLLPSKKLPAEFTNYKTLAQIKKFGNHTVTLLAKDEGCYPNINFQLLTISKDQIILKVATKREPYDHGGGNNGQNFFNTVFKFDSSGNILDTFNFRTSTSNQSEFGEIVLLNKQIVNKDLLYYQTWPTDGNKTEKRFIPLNKDLTWDSEKISNYYYNKIVPNCTYLETFLAWRDDSIPVDRRESLICYTNNDWYVLYGIDRNIYEDALMQISHHNKKIINENQFNIIPEDRVILKYYQKLEYSSSSTGRTQSNPSVYTSYYWNGIGYFHIPFENDTLKLKHDDIILDHYDTKEKSKYETKRDDQKDIKNQLREMFGFYSNPYLSFSLISDSNSNIYIIKKTK